MPYFSPSFYSRVVYLHVLSLPCFQTFTGPSQQEMNFCKKQISVKTFPLVSIWRFEVQKLNNKLMITVLQPPTSQIVQFKIFSRHSYLPNLCITTKEACLFPAQCFTADYTITLDLDTLCVVHEPQNTKKYGSTT